MNIEFHYNTIYLIALKAGYTNNESKIIAYSSQYVDDNTKIYNINVNTDNEYSNYISQTINILKPKNKLLRIYSLFHFIPGDFLNKNNFRKDGKFHILNTTPNSKNAKTIFKNSLKTNDLYKIGIACHTYADTWAHANFVGYYEEFNSLKGILNKATPDIGHADAKHNPDLINHVWYDTRLINQERNNNKIFLKAATHIFKFLYKLDKNNYKQNKKELINILTKLYSIDNYNKRNDFIKEILLNDYNITFESYNENEWFNQCIYHTRKLKNIFCKKFYWKNINEYKNTNWYKFQESIKWYQNMSWEVLNKTVFSKIDLLNL